MNNSLSRILALTNRNLKEILRDPLSLIFTILLPLIMEVMFYFLFSKLTSQFEIIYLAPAIVVFSQSFITLFIGLLISIDRTTSFLTRLFVSKTKPHEFIISYVLSIIPIIFFQSILFFAVGGFIDTSLFKLEMIYSILLSLVTSLFFIGTGILFGALFNEKSIGGISSLIISMHSLLSGMWFPIDGLSGLMVRIMDILPFKNSTILIQNALIGVNDLVNDFLYPFINILLYSVIILLISIIVFRKKMKSN